MTAKENQNIPVWTQNIASTVLAQMCQQLNKDLNRAGFFEQLNNTSNPVLMKNQLETLLKKQLTKDDKKILNLLYAVDISENEFKTFLSEQTEELSSALTWLILKRTWQKINFRLNGF